MKILSPKLLVMTLSLVFNYNANYAKTHKFHEPKINISIEYNHQTLENKSANIVLNVALAKEQLVYANSIHLSIDAPDATDITLSKPHFNQKNQIDGDYRFNDSATFSDNFNINTIANYTKNHTNPVNLHLSFLLSHPKRIYEKVFSIVLAPQALEQLIQATETEQKHPAQTLDNDSISISTPSPDTWWNSVTKFSSWLQTSLRSSSSLTLRLILIFLLGLLMSLTPCIYPMIPITAGILQAQGSSSLGRSFLLAFTYTLGTSTTFAVFGLIAAITHHLFGQLLVNPFLPIQHPI